MAQPRHNIIQKRATIARNQTAATVLMLGSSSAGKSTCINNVARFVQDDLWPLPTGTSRTTYNIVSIPAVQRATGLTFIDSPGESFVNRQDVLKNRIQQYRADFVIIVIAAAEIWESGWLGWTTHEIANKQTWTQEYLKATCQTILTETRSLPFVIITKTKPLGITREMVSKTFDFLSDFFLVENYTSKDTPDCNETTHFYADLLLLIAQRKEVEFHEAVYDLVQN